jgi:CRISPR/Cas system-associated endonuclease Cas1
MGAAMKSTCAALSRLEENPPEDISDLSALEANRGASYFRSWVGVPIKWRGISRRPISENWHSIGQRSSPDHLAGNRNAAHPVNAILNYAYAALESEIRIKAIEIGATDGPNGGVWSVNLFAVPQTSTM